MSTEFVRSGSSPSWTLPVEHLSATSLAMMQACPRQWQQRYIHHRKEAPGAARVIGQVNHLAHGFHWSCKALTQNDVPTASVLDFYDDVAWPKTIDEFGGVDEIKWDTGPTDARTLSRLMVTAYHEQVSHRVMPVEVEKEVCVVLDGLPVPLIGFIDVTQQDAPLIDLKTSARKLSKVKPGWWLQGLVYQLAEGCPVDWHVVTKAKAPAVFTPLEEAGLAQPLDALSLAAGRQLINDLAWTTNYYYQTYGPDEPWPQLGKAHDWRCDWCAYKGDCPIWRVTPDARE